MKSLDLKQYLIIGDIIKSRTCDGKVLWKKFNLCIKKVNKDFQFTIPLVITLGDEYQGVVSSYKEAQKIQKVLRKTMKPYGLRTVIVPIHGDLTQKPEFKFINPLNTCEMLYAQDQIKALKNTKRKIFEQDILPKSVRKKYASILSLDYVTGKGLKK